MAIEDATRANAEQMGKTGAKLGRVGVNIFHESYTDTLQKGMMRIVEDELPDTKAAGVATANQLLKERRNALVGYFVRLSTLALIIGSLALCVSAPFIPALIITIIISVIGSFLTDPRI